MQLQLLSHTGCTFQGGDTANNFRNTHGVVYQSQSDGSTSWVTVNAIPYSTCCQQQDHSNCYAYGTWRWKCMSRWKHWTEDYASSCNNAHKNQYFSAVSGNGCSWLTCPQQFTFEINNGYYEIVNDNDAYYSVGLQPANGLALRRNTVPMPNTTVQLYEHPQGLLCGKT